MWGGALRCAVLWLGHDVLFFLGYDWILGIDIGVSEGIGFMLEAIA